MKVAAFLLPDKIIIETTNKKDAGTWYSTGEHTIVPLHASDVELGNKIPKKMFYRLPGDITEVEYVPENAESIGKELRNCWSKCVTEN